MAQREDRVSGCFGRKNLATMHAAGRAVDGRATTIDASGARRRARRRGSSGPGLAARGQRRRADFGHGLLAALVGLIAGCSGEPAGAPVAGNATPEPVRGAMVPASTRDVPLLHGPPGLSLAADAGQAPSPRPAVHEEPPTSATPKDPQPTDPRAVPPGTSAQVARVFQRLPVAIHDGPPLGAIGETGIHVDKIWLGSSYVKDGCAGEASTFSLAKHEQVNVCFRVVHAREEEAVEVEWVKDGAPFRRRAVNIPDLHAYRSRAWLVLRREYIGSWQARVLSADQAPLATIAFTVTP